VAERSFVTSKSTLACPSDARANPTSFDETSGLPEVRATRPTIATAAASTASSRVRARPMRLAGLGVP
jgi:hypothetical protein